MNKTETETKGSSKMEAQKKLKKKINRSFDRVYSKVIYSSNQHYLLTNFESDHKKHNGNLIKKAKSSLNPSRKKCREIY